MGEFVCTRCGKTVDKAVDEWADRSDGVLYCGPCWEKRKKSDNRDGFKCPNCKTEMIQGPFTLDVMNAAPHHHVLCVKHVVTTMADMSETDAWLFRAVTMPAPPAPGSYVTNGKWESRACEVAWFTNLAQYVAFSEPDTELRDAHMNQKHHHRSVEEIASDWVAAGWTYLGHGATLIEAMLFTDPDTIREATGAEPIRLGAQKNNNSETWREICAKQDIRDTLDDIIERRELQKDDDGRGNGSTG